MPVPCPGDVAPGRGSPASSFSPAHLLNPSLRTSRLARRRHRAGLALCRRGLIGGCGGCEGEGDGPPSPPAEDGPGRLIYRPPPHLMSVAECRYVACAFLGDGTGAVAAMDGRGTVDAVRPPLRRRGRGDGGSDGGADADPNADADAGTGGSEAGRPGSLVAGEGTEGAGPVPPGLVRMFATADGGSLAVGTSGNGGEEVRIFSTERLSGGGGREVLGGTLPPRRGGGLRCVHRRGAPRRRLGRDWEHGGSSLRRMVLGQCGAGGGLGRYGSPSSEPLPPEIHGWDEGRYSPSRGRSVNFDCGPRFDFREVGAGGSLLAARVDPEHDCFSLTICDGRLMMPSGDGGVSTTEGTPGGGAAAVIGVDLGPSTGFEDFITSVAFVGEHAIATSHVAHSDGWIGRPPGSNVIKFWDMRMMSGSPPAKPALETQVSSFPLNPCHGLEPVATVGVDEMREQHSYGVSLLDDALTRDAPGGSDAPDFAIVRLHGSVVSSTVSATAWPMYHPAFIKHGRRRAPSQLLIDANRASLLHSTHFGGISPGRGVSDAPKPVFTPTLDFMATYDRGVSSRTVRLFDLSRATSCLSGEGAAAGRRKRPRQEGSGRDSKDDELSVGAFGADVTDEYGCAADIECMALNSHGSSFVAGTADGDLYVWG